MRLGAKRESHENGKLHESQPILGHTGVINAKRRRTNPCCRCYAYCCRCCCRRARSGCSPATGPRPPPPKTKALLWPPLHPEVPPPRACAAPLRCPPRHDQDHPVRPPPPFAATTRTRMPCGNQLLALRTGRHHPKVEASTAEGKACGRTVHAGRHCVPNTCGACKAEVRYAHVMTPYRAACEKRKMLLLLLLLPPRAHACAHDAAGAEWWQPAVEHDCTPNGVGCALLDIRAGPHHRGNLQPCGTATQCPAVNC